jgi:S1-C subfamily serine protease
MVARVTLDLLNAESAPKFAKVDSNPRIFRGPQPSSVVMGIVPDQGGETAGPGWPIAEVMEGGGAAKAGMKAGDRILSVDGQTIGGLSDYYKATEKKKAGDVVAVNVMRGKEEITLQVELGARQ